MTSQLSVPSLCKTIKALGAKGDHAANKAEQFYIAAGKHLAELKGRCPSEWLQHAKEKVGIGRGRAHELMAIGTGVRTVEQVREDTRQRVEHHRGRPLRNRQVVWVTKKPGRCVPTSSPSVTVAWRMWPGMAVVAGSCRVAQ
jgi:hypothetical protein